MERSPALRTLRRLVDDERRLPFRVIFDPSRSGAGAGELLIGLGASSLSSLHENAAPEQGLCLNPKGAETEADSVSALAGQLPPSVFAAWAGLAQALEGGEPPGFRVVVEDLGPDTLFALLRFLLGCLGVEDPPPAAWQRQVGLWEKGRWRTDSPETDWVCLHSALAHGLVYRPRTGEDLTAVCAAALGLLCDHLLAGHAPDACEPLLDSAADCKARALLNYERRAYEQSLEQARLVQLLIPLAFSADRYLLADAYLAVEKHATGNRKVFLRSDREHAYFGSGFTLMAVHRPDLAGSGMDTVISADPAAGVSLETLWRELERAEDARWEGGRRRDRPRPLASYPAGDGPNEPWWDDQGRYTLVASPKAVDGQPGSRLSWAEVSEILWRCYQPARLIRVRPFLAGSAAGEGCAPHACPDRRRRSGKRFASVLWCGADGADLLLTPTTRRYLAACARAVYPEGVKLADLPDPGSFALLHLPGGFAAIHADGVFVLDDWSEQRLDIEACCKEFEQVASRLESIQRLHAKLSNEVDAIEQRLTAGRRLNDLDIVNRLGAIRLELRRVVFDTLPIPVSDGATALRQEMERRWGMDAQLEALEQTADQLDALIQNYSEVRTNRLINGLTLYGFPAALLAGFFGFVFEGLATGSSWGGIHWTGLGLFAALCLAAILLLRRAVEPRQHR